MTNRLPGVQTSTKIGCVSDIDARMAIHNSAVPVVGSERRARKAAGHWKPLLVIVVPSSSGLSARALADEWASGTRRIHCRFEYGIERIARHYGLPYMVDTDELVCDERITKALPDLCRDLTDTVVTLTPSPDATSDAAPDTDVPSHIVELANLVLSSDYQLRETRHYNDKSFAKVDRPRRRSSVKASSRKRRSPRRTDSDSDSDWEPQSRRRTHVVEPSVSGAALDSLMCDALAGRSST